MSTLKKTDKENGEQKKEEGKKGSRWGKGKVQETIRTQQKIEQVILAVTLWTCIQEVLGSNLDRDAGCPQ
jgi:hypothetical protein